MSDSSAYRQKSTAEANAALESIKNIAGIEIGAGAIGEAAQVLADDPEVARIEAVLGEKGLLVGEVAKRLDMAPSEVAKALERGGKRGVFHFWIGEHGTMVRRRR